MQGLVTDPENLRPIEGAIRDTVMIMHPGVVFTDIWIEPRKSWCGSDMVDVWAIYDGDIADLAVPGKPSLGTRIQDILWNMGVDASPSTHLVAKTDAKGLKPATV